MQVLTVDYQSPNAPALFFQSLRDTGFAVLNNHPIQTALIEQTYAKWKDFFSSDAKFQYLYQRPSQAGYFPFKTENAKNSRVSDLKEFYHYYPTGPKPKEAAALSDQMYADLFRLAAELLGWIESQLPLAVASQLPAPLHTLIDGAENTLLRILHYPPLSGEIEAGAVRAAAHEDINLITLLPAATAPGLEVQDTAGAWHEVPCYPGHIAVNVGDMLQECTQHYLKSTTHRVVNPAAGLETVARYSMPLFLHPRAEVRLSPSCTAGEYLVRRLKEIGIY